MNPEDTLDPHKLIDDQMARMRLKIHNAVILIDPEETYGGSDRVSGVIGAKMISDLVGAFEKLTPKKVPLTQTPIGPASFPRIPRGSHRPLETQKNP